MQQQSSPSKKFTPSKAQTELLELLSSGHKVLYLPIRRWGMSTFISLLKHNYPKSFATKTTSMTTEISIKTKDQKGTLVIIDEFGRLGSEDIEAIVSCFPCLPSHTPGQKCLTCKMVTLSTSSTANPFATNISSSEL